MIEAIMGLGGYGWLALGLAVLLAEVLIVGTGHLLWIGIAAVLAAVLAWLGLSWTVQWVAFALLSIAGAVGWHSRQRRKARHPDAADALNDRAGHMIGREAQLVEPIVDGRGRIRLGDATWLVSGPDLAAGSRVKIVAATGVLLEVMPL